MSRVVACHQPNFLPWLGYFAKLRRADVFLLLDDVQFTQGHNKHNWTTRVKVATRAGPRWIGVPARRSGMGKQAIAEVTIDGRDPRWRRKVTGTLEQSYGGCPFFAEVYPGLRARLDLAWDRLCPLNVELITWIVELLGLDTEVRLSSSHVIGSASTQRLIDLVRAVGGTAYLAGDGAVGYQQEAAFAAAGLELSTLGFAHPVYPQATGPEFLPGLSIVDALFNLGAVQTRALLDAVAAR